MRRRNKIALVLGCGAAGLYVVYLLRRNNTLLSQNLIEVQQIKMALTGIDISQKTGERIGATVGGMVERFALPWVVKVIFGLLFGS